MAQEIDNPVYGIVGANIARQVFAAGNLAVTGRSLAENALADLAVEHDFQLLLEFLVVAVDSPLVRVEAKPRLPDLRWENVGVAARAGVWCRGPGFPVADDDPVRFQRYGPQ